MIFLAFGLCFVLLANRNSFFSAGFEGAMIIVAGFYILYESIENG